MESFEGEKFCLKKGDESNCFGLTDGKVLCQASLFWLGLGGMVSWKWKNGKRIVFRVKNKNDWNRFLVWGW